MSTRAIMKLFSCLLPFGLSHFINLSSSLFSNMLILVTQSLTQITTIFWHLLCADCALSLFSSTFFDFPTCKGLYRQWLVLSMVYAFWLPTFCQQKWLMIYSLQGRHASWDTAAIGKPLLNFSENINGFSLFFLVIDFCGKLMVAWKKKSHCQI